MVVHLKLQDVKMVVHLDGLYSGYIRSGLHWLPGPPCTRDHTHLETVYRDGIIQPETNRRTLATPTICCSRVTRNNESHNIDVPSSARIYTTYEMHTAAQIQLSSAGIVRPKSPCEDVHASTGHPDYNGMQWHQKNYTNKDTASARGICQGCAFGSAHQYPTNQHYVKSGTPHDPRQQFIVDAFTHHGIGYGGFMHLPGFPTRIPRVHKVKAGSRTHWVYVKVILCSFWLEAQRDSHR